MGKWLGSHWPLAPAVIPPTWIAVAGCGGGRLYCPAHNPCPPKLLKQGSPPCAGTCSRMICRCPEVTCKPCSHTSQHPPGPTPTT